MVRLTSSRPRSITAGRNSSNLWRHQWFAAGDTNLVDAGCLLQKRHSFDELASRQLVLRLHQSFTVRHTIGAGVVAGSSQTDAQVGELSTQPVNNHGKLGQAAEKAG